MSKDQHSKSFWMALAILFVLSFLVTYSLASDRVVIKGNIYGTDGEQLTNLDVHVSVSDARNGNMVREDFWVHDGSYEIAMSKGDQYRLHFNGPDQNLVPHYIDIRGIRDTRYDVQLYTMTNPKEPDHRPYLAALRFQPGDKVRIKQEFLDLEPFKYKERNHIKGVIEEAVTRKFKDRTVYQYHVMFRPKEDLETFEDVPEKFVELDWSLD